MLYVSIFYLNQPYYYYDSNPDYHHISLDHSLIPMRIDYQSILEVTKQETEETNYQGTKTEEQIRSKNYYNSKALELVNEQNLVLGLIQENSIENSVQNCLSYILKPYGLCYYYFQPTLNNHVFALRSTCVKQAYMILSF